jgi:signal transduction histidine kinase
MVQTSLIQSRALLARQQLIHQQQHKRLARRIHDDISQQLTLLHLQLSLASTDTKPPANWALACKQWADMVLELGQNLRNIINELQPRILDELGLGAALQWYVHSCPGGVNCKLVLPAEQLALAPSAAGELFAICRDIVSEVFVPNSITEASIVVEQTTEVVRLHLSTRQKAATLWPMASKALDGLSIHERLFCLDGSVETRQEPAGEFAVSLSMPANRQPVSNAA